MRPALCRWWFLLLAVGVMLPGCKPQSTGDDDAEATPTPTVTPEPTPPPDAEGEYRINTMSVASQSVEEVDITGDGKTDNGLEAALKDFSKWLAGRVSDALAEAAESDTGPLAEMTDNEIRALQASISAAIQAFLNVETINRSLEQMVDDNYVIEVITAPEPGAATVLYAKGDFNPTGQIEPVDTLGLFTGDYFYEDKQVDATGSAFKLDLILTSGAPTDGGTPGGGGTGGGGGGGGGGGNIPFPKQAKPTPSADQPAPSPEVEVSITLEQCRTLELWDPSVLIKARIGGAISVQELEDMVNQILDVLGVGPFLEKEQIEALQQDINALLNDMADIKLKSGEAAISVSLVYNADQFDIAY